MKKVASERLCLSCGSQLGTKSAAAVCPLCLLTEASTWINGPGSGFFQPPGVEDLEDIFPELSIKRLIGRGGMGAVYEAEKVELELQVALKILPPETAEDLEFRERFRREAATLAKLDHPNIVRLYDFGERKNYFFILMELVEGGDLGGMINGEPLEFELAISIMRQLCAALDYSHGKGVLHRDIKPGNLLLEEDGRLKVVDFGLAKAIEGSGPQEHLTLTQVRLGTPQYMAPEQYGRTRKVDERADLFSAGAVFYEMLTGQAPMGKFVAASKFNGLVPGTMDRLISKALAPEREKRFQSALEMGEALEAKRRWPWMVGLGGVAAVVLAFQLSRGAEEEVREPLVAGYFSSNGIAADPVEQGWRGSEVKLGEGGNVKRGVDGGWQINDCLDAEELNLPAYYFYPETGEEMIKRMFDEGWEFSFTYRIKEQGGSSDYAAFCGWRVSGRFTPEEWGIPEGKSARLGLYLGQQYSGVLFRKNYEGYFISRDIGPAIQLGQKERTSAFVKGSISPGQWHTVKMIGRARSPAFDYFLDGEYAGSGRVSDELLGDTKEPLHLVFYSGSPGEVDRVSEWLEVALQTGTNEDNARNPR